MVSPYFNYKTINTNKTEASSIVEDGREGEKGEKLGGVLDSVRLGVKGVVYNARA
eukprot:m.31115 g.31115  ORF g.31115 m.31115 type:complete len:55 (+) comp6280_c0_seq1:1976-2140(+)